MAVPKKRTSKSKTASRKSVWKRKARKAADKALSTARSILKSNPQQIILDQTLKLSLFYSPTTYGQIEKSYDLIEELDRQNSGKSRSPTP